MNSKRILTSHVQWHITTNCSNRCKHCYMYDESTYEDEKNNTLSLKDLIKILDDMSDFERKYNLNIKNFHISGGDPLMREDWYDFLLELKKRDKTIYLMGNPETLTEKNLSLLSTLNIKHFQMSLDGLEKTHDYFRAKGSFQRTIDKLKLLKKHNIKSNIMFTLYPTNANELIDLIRFVANKTDANSFCFDIGCFVGCGSQIQRNFTHNEIQQIFTTYLDEKRRLKKSNNPLILHEKSNLLKLIRFQNNQLYPIKALSTPVISGCNNGWTLPSILSDGTCLACRRMTLKVGKMPEESLENIFLGNKLLKKFRREDFFKGCKGCELYSICRGCPANVNSLTKDPFAENPICFKSNINKKTIQTPTCSTPSLNTTYSEEWKLISSFYSFRQAYEQYLENPEFPFIYLDLSQDEKKRSLFLQNPYTFLKENNYKLSQDEIAWLMFYFSEQIVNEYDPKEDPLAKLASINILKQAVTT